MVVSKLLKPSHIVCVNYFGLKQRVQKPPRAKPDTGVSSQEFANPIMDRKDLKKSQGVGRRCTR